MKPKPIKAGNALLAKVPEPIMQRLRDHFQAVDFPRGKVLYEARSPIEYSYFPNSGTLSAVAVMRDGSMIEVATIGNEGGVGLPILSQVGDSPNRVFAQVPGEGVRIKADFLSREVQKAAPLKELIEAYQKAFLFQVSQSVACNGLHQVPQRCCRWLLATHDRVEGDEINLTHEILAIMLGVRRATVTEVLQAMEGQGLVGTSRGKITVLKRAALEAASCECYRDVRDEYQRLLG
jgi:CRP-like cAMP-binding protein